MLSVVPIAATGKTRVLPPSEDNLTDANGQHHDHPSRPPFPLKRQIRSTVAEKGLGARWKGQLGTRRARTFVERRTQTNRRIIVGSCDLLSIEMKNWLSVRKTFGFDSRCSQRDCEGNSRPQCAIWEGRLL